MQSECGGGDGGGGGSGGDGGGGDSRIEESILTIRFKSSESNLPESCKNRWWLGNKFPERV